MSGRGVRKQALQRTGAIKRTRNFERAVDGQLNNPPLPPRSQNRQNGGDRVLRRGRGTRGELNLRGPAAQDADRADSPPPSIDEEAHNRFVRQIERVSFDRPGRGPGNLFLDLDQSLRDEKEIEKRLGLAPLSPAHTVYSHLKNNIRVNVPPLFKQNVLALLHYGDISERVARYYLEVVPRGDSKRMSHGGHTSMLLQNLLAQDTDSGWKPVSRLGAGGFGSVILWERLRSSGKPLRIATKDTRPYSIFEDYCSEAHLTRRLNDLACKNVINVVEWTYIGASQWQDHQGDVHTSEAKHRICYEYAEHGDLFRLVSWYRHFGLILPESFIWHVFHSLANALCYCKRGGNGTQPTGDWDEIRHGDVKEENVFLTAPDPDQNQLYPCVKLGDFGMAYTNGLSVPEVRRFKSATRSGTPGFMAPEVEDTMPEQQRRPRASHELHGPKSDIWSLGATFREILTLPQKFLPGPVYFEDASENQDSPNRMTYAQLVYSDVLFDYLKSCMIQNPKDRIDTYALFEKTELGMQVFRKLAYKEARNAKRQGQGCYPSQVLFTREEKKMFETDPSFREEYTKINLQRLNDKINQWNAGNERGTAPTSGAIRPRGASLLRPLQPPTLPKRAAPARPRGAPVPGRAAPAPPLHERAAAAPNIPRGPVDRARLREEEQRRGQSRPQKRVSAAVNKIFAKLGLGSRAW